MSAVEERLAAHDLTVPGVAAPVAAYAPAVRSGSWVFTSGQLPSRDGSLLRSGRVGATVSADDAHECARVAALNVLAAIKSVIGDLDAVRRVVKVTVFVASDPDFFGQPQVANGASELFALAFDEVGVHARSAVGVASLPLDAPVEVEAIVEVAS